MGRNTAQKVLDFATFPLRAVLLFESDRWRLSSLRTERFEYVSREVIGYCLDVGCGKGNLFIRKVLGGRGKGIDFVPREGLADAEVIPASDRFPFEDGTFHTVTFIANLYHIPIAKRDAELGEAYRCLMPGGNIVVTMGNAVAEMVVHGLALAYDRIFKTTFDMKREVNYLTDEEIVALLSKTGFTDIAKKHMATQWGLNRLFVGWKR